ncbi:MAG TPA: sugar transferase [Geminicoccaceae bacterium]|nr:sugar transferase [Geminicoccaceae bacterium]
MYRRFGKRLLDIAIGVPALVALAPLLAAVAALVRIRLGAPVLFRQRRPGLNGRPFTLWKFRTMTDGRDARGEPLPDEARLTPFGRTLRATSLDELPGLFQVIAGRMSLVGPRPLMMEYLDRYSPEQRRRNEVRPGITGWAQVNGRNGLDWDTKLALDVWYVDRVSLWLDLRILALTLWRVLRRDGISEPGHATASDFLGPEQPDRAGGD